MTPESRRRGGLTNPADALVVDPALEAIFLQEVLDLAGVGVAQGTFLLAGVADLHRRRRVHPTVAQEHIGRR